MLPRPWASLTLTTGAPSRSPILWNRGVLDVVVANQKGPLLVYKNTVTPENEWIEFELEGTASNRSAIGAQVTLFWNGQQQVQEVSGGSGFAAQNDRRLHFGLGKNPQIEKAVIRWPSGKVQTIEKPAAGPVAQDQGARMSQQTTAPLTPMPAAPARWKQLISLDNRYIAPIFITCILLAGHLSFGILESYQKTLLAIVTSIGTELTPRPNFFSQVAASRQRLHHRHQRRHPGALARLLAVRACAPRSPSRRNMCCA